MKAVIAWCLFIAGCTFIVVDIVRLQMTGLALLGAVLLAIWLLLIGAFKRSFWISDDPRYGAIDNDLDAGDHTHPLR